MSATCDDPRPRTSGAPLWRPLLREPQLWIVPLVILVLLAPVLLGHSTLFFRDLYRQQIATARWLHGGGVGPLWNPLLNGGQPLLGDPNQALLYPSRLLYLVLPPATGLNWEIALHLLLAALLSYLLGRVVGLSTRAAVAVAAVFSLGGIPLSLTNHEPRLLSYPWIALSLLAAARLSARRRRHLWLAVLAACVALEMLSGTIEAAVVTVVLVTGWQLAGRGGLRARISGAAMALGSCLLGLGLAGIQLVPGAVLVGRSMRPLTATAPYLLAWSLHPVRLLELAYPGVLGPVATATPAASYWGARFVDFGFPYLLSLYVGIPALVLALGGVLGNESEPISRRRRRYLAMVVVLAAALALGRRLPGLAGAVDHLGSLALIRFPVKALLLASLPLALLAGVGLDRVVANRVRGTLAAVGAGLVVLSLALFAATVIWPTAAGHWLGLAGQDALQHALAGVRRSLLHGGIAAASMVGALLPVGLAGSLRSALLAAIVLLDVGLAAPAVLPTAPRALLAGRPELVTRIRQALGDARFYRDRDPPELEVRLRDNTAAAVAAWWMSVLDGYLGTAYGLPMVFHPDDPLLSSARMFRLTQRLGSLPWDRRVPLLSAARVGVVMTPEAPVTPHLEAVGTVAAGDDLVYRLYRNDSALPGAWFVPTAVVAPSEAAALDEVCSRRFDPWHAVILEPAAPQRGIGVPAGMMLAQPEPALEVTAPRDGFVVFSEAWDPGWRVQVDGVDVPLLHANYAFSAVAVDRGTHLIRRVYRPLEVTLGLWLTLAAALGLVVAVWLTRDGVRAGSLPS